MRTGAPLSDVAIAPTERPRRVRPLVALTTLLAIPLLTGCDARELQHVADRWLADAPAVEQAAYLHQLARVMPFYVIGALVSGLLLVATMLNGLEHARNMGRDDAIRYSAWLGLLGFVALFLAMAFPAEWLPPGHPLIALGGALALSAGGTLAAAGGAPERAVLRTGYFAATLGLPLFGLLFNRDVYLMDTTASLFIGQASGLLLVIVLSGPLRAGLVDFVRRREDARKTPRR
ncbi:MAG: hypothetical protein H6703_05265 [Myxococcales bacterium]|nr:hypothetical protein [Myxococcales bacterium]